MSSISNGLVTKSYAPARMAAIAVSMLPNAVMTTTGRSSRLCDDLLAELDAAHAVHVDVGHDDVEVVLGEPAQRVLRSRGRRGSRSRASSSSASSTSHMLRSSSMIRIRRSTMARSPRSGVPRPQPTRLQGTCRLGRARHRAAAMPRQRLAKAPHAWRTATAEGAGGRTSHVNGTSVAGSREAHGRTAHRGVALRGRLRSA